MVQVSSKFKKRLLFVLAIGFFFLGYNIAPDPLPDGEYFLAIKYEDTHEIIIVSTVTIDSFLDEEISFHEVSTTITNSTLSLSFYKKYSGKMAREIIFFASVLEEGKKVTSPDIQKFTSVLRGKGQEIEIPPTGLSGSDVEFRFKILKHSNIALALLFCISFLWLSEAVPLAATSLLIPVVAVVVGIDTSTGALSQFSNPTVFLFLSGFLMAVAMKKSGLDEFIALEIISRVPPNSKMLLAAFMGLATVFSMFMSNTAAVAMLIPIALQLLNNIGIKDEGFKKAIVLGIAYSAAVGGIGTLIGSPPNVIAVGMIESFNPEVSISFLDWLMFGMPVVIIMIPFVYINLLIRFKPNIKEALLIEAKNHCKKELLARGRFTKDQIIVCIVFVSVLVLWITSFLHGLSTGIVALAGAVALFFTGQIKENDLKKINWNAIITFGGGLTLGMIIIRTGLAGWLALKFTSLQDINVVLVMVVIGIATLVLTAIASNTASAAIMVPIILPIAVILGINPVLLAIMVGIICSVDFAIVTGTPPVLLAYSTGIFKIKEIFNIGIILDVIGLLVIIILTSTIYTFFIELI